jgi:molybdate transport system permease protein
VVGYSLLLLLGRSTAFGRFVQDTFHIEVVLTLWGAIIAAFVMACPLLIRTAQAAFASVDRDLIQAARTLGANEGTIFLQIVLPLAFRGVFVGVTLAFARALGEFGATLMLAGNIPGETQTLPLALYESANADDNARALVCAGLLVFVSWLTLLLSGTWGNRIARVRGEVV